MTSGEAPPLYGPGFDRDPAPAYHWLREHSPVHRVEFGPELSAWLVTRYADVVAALADPRLVKDPARGCPVWRESGMGLPLDHRPSLAQHMTNTDPPRHQDLRRLAAGQFSPQRLGALEARVRQVTEQVLDGIAPLGRADLVADVAYPISTTIICELIGIPAEDRARVQRWAAVIDASDGSDRDDLVAATDAIDEYLAALLAHKKAEPGDDLMSDMIRQRHRGEMTDEELTSTAFLILIAGHETTTALVGSATLAALTHPDLAARIRADQGELAVFVEESLRRDCPVRNVSWRFPTEPMRLGGQDLQPGDPVLLSILAANRDAERFADPDAFRLDRDPEDHLAFGRGRHACLGAALARIQGATVLGALLRRFPDLALAEPEEQLRWWPSPIIRGLFALPVVF
ncbi:MULTISPECIES: cytochrome P450 [unclassified Crossiella]|uniref:cytochrome P450 family protein n=1 Tax=unclassified Crossiella TaxID=2620835 RepID=UPI001FFF0BDA|nr:MULTISPECIES: cytochrome P450 [unclassified Crossiella]MCK2239012.1 cytochrome P450 [Crossiella sp. S99.2]MCK2251419.1 cytochrome P450 [Crossiella sp. S99.1]